MAPAAAFLPYCKMAPPHRREASWSAPNGCSSQFALTSPRLSWAGKGREPGAGCRATTGPGGTARRQPFSRPSPPRRLPSPRPAAPAFPFLCPGSRLPGSARPALKAGEGLRAPLPARPSCLGLARPPGLPPQRLPEHHVSFPHGPPCPRGGRVTRSPRRAAASTPFALSRVGLR